MRHIDKQAICRLLHFAAVVLALGLLPVQQQAKAAECSRKVCKQYDFTKHVEWDVSGVKKDANGNFLPQAGVATGSYRYFAHALATDAHSTEHKDNPNPPETQEAIDWLSDKVSQHGNPAKVFWSKINTFDQSKGPAIPCQQKASAKTTHAEGEGNVDISIGPVYCKQGNPKAYVTGTVHVYGHACADPPCNAEEMDPYSDAASAGAIKLTGIAEKAAVVNGRLVDPLYGKVDAKGWLVNAGSIGTKCDKAKGMKDPLVLSFYDDVTGDLIASQTLWEEEWLVRGMSTVSWDDVTGLILTGGTGDMASIDLATLSDWVLNPFNGTASIIDGAFSVTGDLATLAWNVVTEGGVTTATLPVSELSSARDLVVQPSGLGTPVNDLRYEVDTGVEGFQCATASVPEPSAFVALACGLIGTLGLAHRRIRTR